MKRFILLFIFFFVSICAFASDWKEIQSVEIPQGTPVYYETNQGKTKYYIYVNEHSVNVSESNAKAFVSGQRRLELVKWYNPITDSYKYTIRQLKLGDINLNQIKYGKNETHHYSESSRN